METYVEINVCEQRALCSHVATREVVDSAARSRRAIRNGARRSMPKKSYVCMTVISQLSRTSRKWETPSRA